jgi:hypothetical protein
MILGRMFGQSTIKRSFPMTSLKTLLAAGVATVLMSGAAFAATTGVDSLPSYTGTVKHFTITPRGTIDGIILSNGQDVNFPPYLSTQIAYAVKLGDQVTVHGLKAASEPVVQGVSITDSTTHRTVTDNGPAAGFGPHQHGPMQRMMVTGKIAQTLYGPDGAANGVLLDDGTAVHLPPPQATKFKKLLKTGDTIAVVGAGTANDLGRVVMAQRIGSSFKDLQVVARPRPPHGPFGPHGGPMGWHHGPRGMMMMHEMMMHGGMMGGMMHGPHGGPMNGPMGHRPPPPAQNANAQAGAANAGTGPASSGQATQGK